MGDALRVYLMISLSEAKTQMNNLKSEIITLKNLELESMNQWYAVLSIAEQVVQYIQNCQSDDDQNIFLTSRLTGLAAVDRAQQALVFALKSARGLEIGELRCKAMRKAAFFTVNMLSAKREGDRELTVLWQAAAQKCESLSRHPFVQSGRDQWSVDGGLSNGYWYKTQADKALTAGTELDKEAGLVYMQVHNLRRKSRALKVVLELRCMPAEFGNYQEVQSTLKINLELIKILCIAADQLRTAARLQQSYGEGTLAT